MAAYAAWVAVALVVLQAHEESGVLEEIKGFEGVEDFVELEDLELLVWWVGPEDLLHWPLFPCYEYIISCLIIIRYIFSLSSLHSIMIIRISFLLVLRSQMSPYVI